MSKKETVSAYLSNERVIAENTDAARDLYGQSRYGAMIEGGRLDLSLIEALYLISKEKIAVLDGRKKEIPFEAFFKKAKKYDRNLWIKYVVFKDLRERGYIVKTALKFGADFRVYDRGVKPGDDHAKWVVFPVHESNTMTWHEFSAKNRVAHSTKKRLLLAVVDEEGDVSYWEARWIRP